MMKKNTLENIGAITVIVSLITFLVILPALTFAFAYVGGMIINFFVGEGLVKGLNLMFNTTRFTREMIPLTCATLATIGRYFKSSTTTNSKEK